MDIIIPHIRSVETIEQIYDTGEKPVLVICSDKKSYICKYIRHKEGVYKLVCEYIGSQLAKLWEINTPTTAFVSIKPCHALQSFTLNQPILAFGSCKNAQAIDIVPNTIKLIPASKKKLLQLLKIALFDCWVANEDRNGNNANLMYDVAEKQLLAIDYGCIFNTATFDYKLSALTYTDTILSSAFFNHLQVGCDNIKIKAELIRLHKEYIYSLKRSSRYIQVILDQIPDGWHISKVDVEKKVTELFKDTWIEEVWNIYVEHIKENIQ